jgi:hypothetical protein
MAATQRTPESVNLTVDRIDQLIALFNRKGMDLPDGLFARGTQFLLNGTSYEELLGRSPIDPLILMLARGPAGYRFIVKAVQHAVPDAAVERGDVVWADGGNSCHVDLWLSGRLRGVAENLNAIVGVDLVVTEGRVQRAAASLDQSLLEKLRAARTRP